jgi:hypothetical protein
MEETSLPGSIGIYPDKDGVFDESMQMQPTSSKLLLAEAVCWDWMIL